MNMKRIFIRILIVVAILLASPFAYLGYQRAFNVWWKPPAQIEASLRSSTPLGTSEQGVLSWLRERGVEANIERGPVRANSEYPLTSTGGAAFIQSDLEHHRFIFREDVVAFYTFDDSGKLVDLRVRKDVDGP